MPMSAGFVDVPISCAEGAGQFVHVETPDAARDALLTFLAEHDGTTP